MTGRYPTCERLHELFEYKEGNLYWKRQRNHRARAGDVAGSRALHGYIHVCIDRKVYLAHRLIWLMAHGELPESIDHINGDRADNRLENLRSCTQAENNKNQKLAKTNKSGFKNVSWYAPYSKWRVTVRANGKQKNCGYYEDIELATLVAAEARDKYHGQFSRHA